MVGTDLSGNDHKWWFESREMSDIEIVGVRTIARKLFPDDEFFYCDKILCSTKRANGNKNQYQHATVDDLFYLSGFTMTDQNVLVVVYENDSYEMDFVVKDICDKPKLVEVKNA